MIVDEIGYVPISRTGATLFFQLVNRRYETGSTILTSNQSFEEWGRIFGDEVMATALVDRLLHHCHIVNIREGAAAGDIRPGRAETRGRRPKPTVFRVSEPLQGPTDGQVGVIQPDTGRSAGLFRPSLAGPTLALSASACERAG